MKIRILILFISIVNFAFGQVTTHRNLNVELVEKDSVKSAILQKSVNAFLSEAKKRVFSEEYSDSLHRKKYEFFFNKLSGIGNSKKVTYNNPIILKSYPLKNNEFRVSIAFTGNKKGVPFVFQVTELKAKPYKKHYRFYCTFEDNTKNFKNTKIENITYHHSGEIDTKKAKEFVKFTKKLSKLTKKELPKLDYYCFESLDELLKSYGFLYSARQCNFLCYDLGFTDNNGKMYVTGTNNPNYNYGYISDYIYYNLPNKDQIYWTFVRGIQTYYGGYGLSYDSVQDLKNQFKEELRKKPNINFLEEFKKGRKSSVNSHYSNYVMCTFLFQEAVEKYGFETALKLMYSGKKGEKIFSNLEKYLKIKESDFHNKIVKMINE